MPQELLNGRTESTDASDEMEVIRVPIRFVDLIWKHDPRFITRREARGYPEAPVVGGRL